MGSDRMGSDTTPISESAPPAYQSTVPMTATPEILQTKQPTRRENMAAEAITHPKAGRIQHKVDSKRQKISTKMDMKQQKMNKKMAKLQREVDEEGCCNWTCQFGGLSCGRRK